jgi:hypothetical protein
VLVGKLAFFAAFGIPNNGFQDRGIRGINPRNFKGKGSKNAWSGSARGQRSRYQLK